jgi:hypothetical protein
MELDLEVILEVGTGNTNFMELTLAGCRRLVKSGRRIARRAIPTPSTHGRRAKQILSGYDSFVKQCSRNVWHATRFVPTSP